MSDARTASRTDTAPPARVRPKSSTTPTVPGSFAAFYSCDHIIGDQPQKGIQSLPAPWASADVFVLVDEVVREIIVVDMAVPVSQYWASESTFWSCGMRTVGSESPFHSQVTTYSSVSFGPNAFNRV